MMECSYGAWDHFDDKMVVYKDNRIFFYYVYDGDVVSEIFDVDEKTFELYEGFVVTC